MRIREATEADAGALTKILNDAITDDAAIGKDRIVDKDERIAWIAERHESGFPVLVAVSDDAPDAIGDEEKVVGFASYGSWREGNGYRRTVELSIYVHADHQGEGIGSTLLESLIESARRQKRHVMIAAIESENEASIELHRTFGFELSGQFREVGTKRGEWLNLSIMQLLLDEEQDDQ